MLTPQTIAVGFGVLMAAMALITLLAPEALHRALKTFPRSVWPARILLVVCALWAAWLIYITPMGTLASYKKFMLGFTPIGAWLIYKHLDELLAPRALGGLLIFVAAPLLDGLRDWDLAWRLISTVTVYIMVIKGMTLVLFPYMFRKSVEYWDAHPVLWRIMPGVALVYAALQFIAAFKFL